MRLIVLSGIVLIAFHASYSQFGALQKKLQEKAIMLIEEKVEEKNETYETESFNYAIAFLDKSESFENKQQGENLFKAAAFLNQKEEEITPRDEAKEAYEFGRINYIKRNYKLAETTLKQAIVDFEALGDEKDPLLLKSIGLLGLLYSDMGRYEKAQEYTTRALEGWATYHGISSKGYAAEDNNMAVLKFSQGEYNSAEMEMKKSLELIKTAEGAASMPYAIALNNQAILYQYMGRIEEALKVLSQSLAISAPLLREKSGTYLQLLTNKALILQESTKYAEAEATYKEAINLQTTRLKLNRTSDPDYAHMLNNLASLYAITGRLSEAEGLLKESLTIYQNKFGNSHPLTATAQHDLGNLYRIQGKYVEAEPLINAALTTNKSRLGDKHPKTVQTMEDLAIVNWKKGEIATAEGLYSVVMDYSMSFINEFFPPMSEAEKTKYWDKLKPRYLNFYNFAFDQADANPQLLERALNYRMATKGLLLSTSAKIKNTILNGNDEILIAQYNKWTDQKKALAIYYSLSKEELAEQKIDLTEMERQANQAERDLSQKSSAFSEVMVSSSKSYKDILPKLAANEVAIEMIQYPYFDTKLSNSIRYAAIILKAGNAPKLVILEDGKDLEGKFYKSYKNLIKLKVSDDYSYAKYWEKIAQEIGAASKIYFSPDGVYSQINLYTLKTPDGSYLVSKKDISLVGNIADLIDVSAAKNVTKSAFLLGFPTYGSSSIAPLPGTGKEVGIINDALKANQYQITLKTGVGATETAIKAIKSPKLVHIATHGYFMEDVQSSGNVFGVQVENARNNPLLKSGLLLAGASENGEQAGQSFNQEDNGVLTAYEAMNLSLENTDMVVLSACETGKGDVKSGEGVYGLQRAFTVAGAKRLVMSLWVVDDTATQMLMSSFYSNWIQKSMAPSDAFRKAQIDLMKTYPEPYYWGAFVMMQ
jgi:CHAT domain-containing protein